MSFTTAIEIMMIFMDSYDLFSGSGEMLVILIQAVVIAYLASLISKQNDSSGDNS